jgi:pilus assembly protein CpaF
VTLTHEPVGLVDDLDRAVRELVRREGVDPQRDAGVVRRLAESVVRAHDERSLTGQVVPVADVGALVGELVARVSGFGPWQAFLDDPGVSDSEALLPDRSQERAASMPAVHGDGDGPACGAGVRFGGVADHPEQPVALHLQPDAEVVAVVTVRPHDRSRELVPGSVAEGLDADDRGNGPTGGPDRSPEPEELAGGGRGVGGVDGDPAGREGLGPGRCRCRHGGGCCERADEGRDAACGGVHQAPW